MEKTQEFHSADLMRVLDARPHELRAWLRLEPLASRDRLRRSATAYTALDALFLAIIKQLSYAGFTPKSLQTFSESLYTALQHPPAEDEPDELLLYLEAGDIWRIGQAPEDIDTLELKIPLQEARVHLLRYMGAHLVSRQYEMALLASIKGGSSRSAKTANSRRRTTR